MSGAAATLLHHLHHAQTPLPDYLSVACAHQRIPAQLLDEIDAFIELFDRITARPAWIREATQGIASLAAEMESQTCFFSAWDFHLPMDCPGNWQLIEFNDNGSGFLFAAQINRTYYDLFLPDEGGIRPPPTRDELGLELQAMIQAEAKRFFDGQCPGGLLILDDRESLCEGRFREEHAQLAALTRARGWRTRVATPDALKWDGEMLRCEGERIAFIVNRSTDFLWHADHFDALWQAFRRGRVYVAPNPFSYATRSDKRLLAWLSRPERDVALGIEPEERALLSRHVPPTWVLGDENVETLARRKLGLVFKPAQSHAGLGILNSREVGRHRLRRLLSKGELYVAQEQVAKGQLQDANGERLWTDLRVWSWHGRRYQICGRASRSASRLDLRPPGGWLPTFETVSPDGSG